MPILTKILLRLRLFITIQILQTRFCSSPSDFKIDAGTIHVSGVSCLVKQDQFQRGVCVEQAYGGLRCYDDAAPVITYTPPAVATFTPDPIVDPGAPAEIDEEITSFCLYGPEEATTSSPACAQVRRLHGIE